MFLLQQKHLLAIYTFKALLCDNFMNGLCSSISKQTGDKKIDLCKANLALFLVLTRGPSKAPLKVVHAFC